LALPSGLHCHAQSAGSAPWLPAAIRWAAGLRCRWNQFLTTAFPFPEVWVMANALIVLCAVLVGAGIVSAGCFFWLVYRGPSSEDWQREMEDGRPRL